MCHSADYLYAICKRRGAGTGRGWPGRGGREDGKRQKEKEDGNNFLAGVSVRARARVTRPALSRGTKREEEGRRGKRSGKKGGAAYMGKGWRRQGKTRREEPPRCVYRGTGEKERESPPVLLPSFHHRAPFVSLFLPCVRSKLRAGSQKLPVLEESAWSWIILPKGIFIGRECMQKRGHRHKGAAPADLALTQLAEWTHGFEAGRTLGPRSSAGQTLLGHPRVMDCPTFLFLRLRFFFRTRPTDPSLAGTRVRALRPRL